MAPVPEGCRTGPGQQSSTKETGHSGGTRTKAEGKQPAACDAAAEPDELAPGEAPRKEKGQAASGPIEKGEQEISEAARSEGIPRNGTEHEKVQEPSEDPGSVTRDKGKSTTQCGESIHLADDHTLEDAAEGPFPSMLEGDVDVATDEANPKLLAVLQASERGDLRSLRTALKHLDCPLDTLGPEGDTALHLACLYGHGDCVEALLEAGAPVTARDEDGATPLHDACASGFARLASTLLYHAGTRRHRNLLESADNDGDTPLHNAARGDHPEVVQLLLAHGADPSARNCTGETPRMCAEDSDEVRRLLLEAEAATTRAETLPIIT